MQTVTFLSLTDIDECAANTNMCHSEASCMNTDGGYSCACNGGYTGDGLECNGKVFIHSLCKSVCMICTSMNPCVTMFVERMEKL